jgi:hypothetical protein
MGWTGAVPDRPPPYLHDVFSLAPPNGKILNALDLVRRPRSR